MQNDIGHKYLDCISETLKLHACKRVTLLFCFELCVLRCFVFVVFIFSHFFSGMIRYAHSIVAVVVWESFFFFLKKSFHANIQFILFSLIRSIFKFWLCFFFHLISATNLSIEYENWVMRMRKLWRIIIIFADMQLHPPKNIYIKKNTVLSLTLSDLNRQCQRWIEWSDNCQNQTFKQRFIPPIDWFFNGFMTKKKTKPIENFVVNIHRMNWFRYLCAIIKQKVYQTLFFFF